MSVVLCVAVLKVERIEDARARVLSLECPRDSPRKSPVPVGFRFAFDETLVMPLREDESYCAHEYPKLASARTRRVATLKPQLNAFLDRIRWKRPLFRSSTEFEERVRCERDSS